MSEVTFGEWMRSCRRHFKVSTDDLAKEAHVSTANINRWEHNKLRPHREGARAIGKYFGAEEIGLVLAGYIPETFQRRFTTLILRKFKPKSPRRHPQQPDEGSQRSKHVAPSTPQQSTSTDLVSESLVLPEPFQLNLEEPPT